MNNFLSLIPLLLVALFSINKIQHANNESLKIKKMSIHEFKVENINGEEFDFSSLNGKKIMVVNTASKCGLTPQYEKLEALYQKYKNDNFIIIGFPSNDFMGQEPGSNEEIIAFCKKN